MEVDTERERVCTQEVLVDRIEPDIVIEPLLALVKCFSGVSPPMRKYTACYIS